MVLGWFVLGAVLLLLEMLLGVGAGLWFGVGAFVTGATVLVAGWLGLSMTLNAELVLFVLLSVFSAILYIWRNEFVKSSAQKTGDGAQLNKRGADLLGHSYPLAGAIEAGSGFIVVAGVRWNVRGDDAPIGAMVCLVEQVGVSFKVEVAKDA